MLFNRNDDMPNERILYETKPNMLFGCKKAIYGVVLLAIVLMVSSGAIKFVGKMQVYMVSRINLSLTRYTAIAFFIIILFIIIYIIWQLLSWYSKEYTLTDSRIIIKSGVVSSKKNYMPYATIQDINTSQSIIARLFGVGSISVFSAYDNNQMELSNISDPSKVEEIIFSHMVNSRNFYGHNMSPRDNPAFERNFQLNDDYSGGKDYYDEFEPITPIGRERDMQRGEYEYYPEDLGYNDKRYKEYEYEPYGDDFYRSSERNSIRYEGASNSYSQSGYYNRVREEYSQSNDEYSHDNESGFYHDGDVEDASQNQPQDIGEASEKVIRRHFDKFKK
ncbi:PH domain-containing protein [Methanobrevibacter sp.]|uniref:PH domain-containing protein n=1 Tax=Methanobrevibacter sp. TaxID=66852 RepID=UPI00388EA69F